MLVDPVCGKRIKRQRAHIAIDFRGITYYLCCPHCQADFERTPEKYARPEFGEKTDDSRTRRNNSQSRNSRGMTIVRGPAS